MTRNVLICAGSKHTPEDFDELLAREDVRSLEPNRNEAQNLKACAWLGGEGRNRTSNCRFPRLSQLPAA